MITISVPFSMPAIVGDVIIQDAVIGGISVNLHDDPKDDEINCWLPGTGTRDRLSYALCDKMERAAIAEARRMHQADLDAAKIAAAE